MGRCFGDGGGFKPQRSYYPGNVLMQHVSVSSPGKHCPCVMALPEPPVPFAAFVEPHPVSANVPAIESAAPHVPHQLQRCRRSMLTLPLYRGEGKVGLS